MTTPRIMVLIVLASLCQFLGNWVTIQYCKGAYREIVFYILLAAVVFVTGMVMMYTLPQMLYATLGGLFAGVMAQAVVLWHLRKQSHPR